MRLLTPAEHSPKLAHYTKGDIVGAIMYLAPADHSSRNVCPFASAGCRSACLYTAGRGAMTNTQKARIAKTEYFHSDPSAFVSQLADEIAVYHRKQRRTGAKICAIRLNGTSDIQWERIRLGSKSLMETFPDVQFYDYTKIPRRNVPANYSLTFSLSENNDRHAITELELGRRVAVVLKYETFPESWSGYRTIKGDDHDYRFLDPDGARIVVLRAKGKAKTDRSGFVRDVHDVLEPARPCVPFTLVRAA